MPDDPHGIVSRLRGRTNEGTDGRRGTVARTGNDPSFARMTNQSRSPAARVPTSHSLSFSPFFRPANTIGKGHWRRAPSVSRSQVDDNRRGRRTESSTSVASKSRPIAVQSFADIVDSPFARRRLSHDGGYRRAAEKPVYLRRRRTSAARFRYLTERPAVISPAEVDGSIFSSSYDDVRRRQDAKRAGDSVAKIILAEDSTIR